MINNIRNNLMNTETDLPNKLAIFFLMIAVIVYTLWAGIGFLLPDFYYDRPLERLFFSMIGFILVIYLLSPRAASAGKNSLLLSLYVLILNFHFLSLFYRAGGDEIYALGVLIFIISASLLFLELRLYIGFLIISLAAYLPTFIILDLPSYRIVMLVAGIVSIGVATSLLLFIRIRLSEQYHTQRLAIASLEHQLTEEKLTQQEEETNRYKTAAHYDTITGLPNRKSFQDQLQLSYDLASHENRSFALLFADLDNFKEINDTYGHDAGDTVLYHFAKRLKETLRSSDYPARYAGDEFVAILPNIDTIEEIKPICKRILQIATEPYPLTSGKSCSISVSIGIVLYPEDGAAKYIVNNPQDLLMHADSAMYEAKKHGKNRWVHYSESPRK